MDEVISFRLAQISPYGFVAVNHHLSYVLSVRASYAGHYVFGVQCGKDELRVFPDVDLFHYLSCEDHECAVIRDGVVSLLNPDAHLAAFAEKAESERDLYGKVNGARPFGNGRDGPSACLQIIHEAEFSLDLNSGGFRIQVIYAECADEFIISLVLIHRL